VTKRPPGPDEVLGQGRFLRLLRRDGWELVERSNAHGVVVIVAVTHDGNLILIEQHRIPVGKPVIELPAGLAGDDVGAEGEALATAAARELTEETGYEAERMEWLTAGPSSAGMTSEILTIFRATGVRRVSKGGGVEGESITTHEVPLAQVPAWLARAERRGALVDPKVYAALWFSRAASTSADAE
jgi:ADP-ribose pyrophosphatase